MANPPERSSSFPWWALALAVVLLLVAGLGVLLSSSDVPARLPDAPPSTAAPAARATPPASAPTTPTAPAAPAPAPVATVDAGATPVADSPHVPEDPNGPAYDKATARVAGHADGARHAANDRAAGEPKDVDAALEVARQHVVHVWAEPAHAAYLEGYREGYLEGFSGRAP